MQKFISFLLLCVICFQFVIYQKMFEKEGQRKLSPAELDYLDMVGSSCREGVILDEWLVDRVPEIMEELETIKTTLSIERQYATKKDIQVVVNNVEKMQSVLTVLVNKRHQTTTENFEKVMNNQQTISNQIDSVKRYIGIYCG